MKMRSFFEDWPFPRLAPSGSPHGATHPGYGTTGRQSSVRLNRVTAISIATRIRPASASVS
ncbi:MAG: hypothetical protein QOK01_2902 [Alphaproteobacteria bacterium]|nr:hypothetical protein [Alphaproteobacteria bacterium]